MEQFRPIPEGENPVSKAEIYEWIIDEATRLDLPAIINMLAVVGRWDEQMQSLKDQGMLTGINETYDRGMA